MSNSYYGESCGAGRKLGVALLVCWLVIARAAAGEAPGPSPLRPEHRVALAALVALVDQQISGLGNTLETLAETEEARRGGWRAVKPLLARVQAGAVPCTCWYLRPDGRYYTVSQGLIGESLSDRAYFPGLMAGERVGCALVVSKSTGKKSAVVAASILREGRVVGALGASVFLEELSRQLSALLRLPEDMVFFALDDEGMTVLNARPERVFIDPATAGSPGLTEAARLIVSQPEGMVEYDFEGTYRHLYFQRSSVTGWRFALGVVTKVP